jgi:hypothetical protein
MWAITLRAHSQIFLVFQQWSLESEMGSGFAQEYIERESEGFESVVWQVDKE